MECYWLIYDGNGSVEGATGWYLVVLGQCGAVPVDIWWCWVGGRRTGWLFVVLGQC